jgi:cystathionine gamma-synthase/O-acetylhomoserine (thiol)-lyase
MHSATKGLGGHADAMGGVVVGRPEVMAPVRAARIDLGGVLAPDEAFLLHRGLATLPLRVERQSQTALALAYRLADHSAVRAMLHPGLPSHPDAAVAARLLDPGRFGTCLTLTVHGGRAAGLQLCRALRLVENAPSLGSVTSKISHVATTTHRQVGDDELHAMGLDGSAVRLSVGLEDVDDLADDLERALDGVTG